MKSKKILLTLLSITAMLILSLLTTTNAQAQTFSGRAVGVQSNTTETVGGVATVIATATVADTGQLPPQGGMLSTGIVAGGAINTGVVGATFVTGTLTSTTSGGIVNGVPTSTSQATVNNVNLVLGGNTITATTLQANSQCTCNASTPTCSGNSILTNLVINGITINSQVAPNTTLLSTDITTMLAGTTTRTQTTIIGNEQITSPNSITVNALHITVTSTVTTPLGLTTTTTTDIIIASAHSDINCLQPSAASVSVSGRVLNPRGRGVFNATVTSTDSSGEVRTTRTNPFGYFRFDEIAVGETYILRVRSKGYTFTPQAVSVSEELTGLTFIAGPPSGLKFITEQ